jgi:genome maintenance exonuclease 1
MSWWRKKVGEAEADKIIEAACARGTAVHEATEDYLLKNIISDNEMFLALKREVDKVDNIIGMETFLYNPEIQMAGRVDCIGEYNGKMSIIDFKTSTKMKAEKYLTNYWLQVTSYSLMFEYMTGERIEQLVILMVAKDLSTRSFISNRKLWLQPLLYKIQAYKKHVSAS